MQELVYIGKVIEITPIEGADRIESVTVVAGKGGKWRGTAIKEYFKIGTPCEVYLHDSLLPVNDERFAFMERYHYRVSMRRFKGVPSEVLLMALSSPLLYNLETGEDITELIGVLKYNKPIAPNMAGLVYGDFPAFIPKTDEPNFQKVSNMIEALQGKRFYSTVKADGSSVTFYKKEGHFGCCSRNLELKETPDSLIWQMACKYKLEKALKNNFAIQAELIGEKIQRNPIGIKGNDIRVFNIYDIDNQQYLDIYGVRDFCEFYNLPMVDIVEWDKVFEFQNDDCLREYAEGVYGNGHQREGVVIRPMEEMQVDGARLSFKVINLSFDTPRGER